MKICSPSIVVYLDCFSGISGDMFLAALLDAGLPLAELERQLALVALDGFQLAVFKKHCGAIAASALQVRYDAANQPHRSIGAIRQLIGDSDLSEPVKKRALTAFTALAEAEAKIHGIPSESVHFHEVGAVDSLVDIIGVAIGLDWFGITAIHCSPLPMPRGWVDCAHGRLPLPAPAVCELLKGLPVYGVDLSQELVTPTGAALVKTSVDEFGSIPPMQLNAVGHGAGSQALGNQQPNLLRILIGQSQEVSEAQTVEVIDTHLDDWSPEGYPHLCERLFIAGALDVALTPIQMKKGRPGFALRVLCDRATTHQIKELIFTETTAIGLRFHSEQRMTLPRESGTVPSPWGPVRVKKVCGPTGDSLSPEYEDCRRLADAHQIPLKTVYAAVVRAELQDFVREN